MTRFAHVFGFVIAMVLAAIARADVRAASPFMDHMVLQQNQAVPVWGWADAGESVSVSFAGQTQTVVAGADGKWMVKLGEMKASAAPQELLITGKNKLVFKDVLIGEVWLCSGQSNMDFTLAATPKYYFAGAKDQDAEVAAANYPNIRMFSGLWQRTYELRETIGGTWKVCTPENAREFSAIGYFFARDLQKALNVPVGIITETYGASTVQSWIRRDALASDPDFVPMLDSFDSRAKSFTGDQRAAWATAMAKWENDIEKTTSIEQRIREPGSNGDPATDQHQPTVMYNGMIAPIVPFAIRGVLWYQGESIVGGREQFAKLNNLLIADWRKLWGYDFPFYFCQLAALNNNSNNPWVREAQAKALEIPNTAMAVTIDIGDKANVHPKDKQDVGDRLMRIALANTYGQKIEYYGPMYDSMQIEADTIRIKFTHTTGGLVARGGDLKCFEIAGKDQKFVSARAKIDGDTVIASADEIPDPAAVRYAWQNYPDGCNLYNGQNLAAAPFRTDSWPAPAEARPGTRPAGGRGRRAAATAQTGLGR